MKKIYRHIENVFEKVVTLATLILGNHITFIIALGTVIYFLSNKQFYRQDIHYCIGDIILGVTFLSLFIIQKAFNRFSAALHLKVNELVASHEPASNSIINVEKKTEHEISLLSKEYSDLAQQVEDLKEKVPDH